MSKMEVQRELQFLKERYRRKDRNRNSEEKLSLRGTSEEMGVMEAQAEESFLEKSDLIALGKQNPLVYLTLMLSSIH